jgi:hypothetical protein
MNPTSRSPRLRVVDARKSRRRKPLKRRRIPFTEREKLDNRGLKRAQDAANEGLTDRHPDWVSPQTMATFAAPLGGSRHRTQWEAYLKGARRMTAEDKLCAALFFAQYTMQELFPTWGFPQLTPLPACVHFSADELRQLQRPPAILRAIHAVLSGRR